MTDSDHLIETSMVHPSFYDCRDCKLGSGLYNNPQRVQ